MSLQATLAAEAHHPAEGEFLLEERVLDVKIV
jgi:hypothetical protein